jgi:hypothetical protein
MEVHQRQVRVKALTGRDVLQDFYFRDWLDYTLLKQTSHHFATTWLVDLNSIGTLSVAVLCNLFALESFVVWDSFGRSIVENPSPSWETQNRS